MVEIKHSTTAPLPDEGLLGADEWNAGHNLTGPAGKLLGFDSNGDAEGVAGWRLIAEATADADTFVDFVLPETVDWFRVLVEQVTTSVNANFLLRTSSDGGATFDSGESDYRTFGPSGSIKISSYNPAGSSFGGMTGDFLLFSRTFPAISGLTGVLAVDSSSRIVSYDEGNRFSPDRANAIRLFPATGTMSGSFKILGLVG